MGRVGCEKKCTYICYLFHVLYLIYISLLFLGRAKGKPDLYRCSFHSTKCYLSPSHPHLPYLLVSRPIYGLPELL